MAELLCSVGSSAGSMERHWVLAQVLFHSSYNFPQTDFNMLTDVDVFNSLNTLYYDDVKCS